MAVKGHLDGMSGAYAIGWAVAEPDRGNCAIEILDDHNAVVARGRASRHREDLVALGLGRSTMSFRIAIPDAPGQRRLRVLANGEELAGSPIVVGAGVFDGDAAVSGGTVIGWVTERTTGFQPPLISIFDHHGVKVGEARSRRDLTEIDPLYQPARFAIDLDDRCFGAGELRLTVAANGVKLAELGCDLGLRGNLETVTAERCAGWLLAPDQPTRDFTIEVFRDGVPAGTARCEITRTDVAAVFPGCGAPGFSLALEPAPAALEAATISLRLPGSDVELFEGPYVVGDRAAAVRAAQRAAQLALADLPGMGAAERAVLQLALRGFLDGARHGNGFTAPRQPDLAMVARDRPRLTIIVPVYSGIEATRDCLTSILQHRNPATDHLVVINDAAPDPVMAPMLAQLSGVRNVFLLTNESNLGFVRTVNRGLRFAAGSDVLLLNADTVLFAGGLDELCRVAQSAAEIGTVTAISNNATIFSYPHPLRAGSALADAGWTELAAIALAENAGIAIDVPTGHGFCMLIKAEVMRRVGLLDEQFGRGYGEENDFCARAADLGYRHVAAAGVLVEHRESVSFGDEKAGLMARNLPRLNAMYPEYTAIIMAFERQDGLREARWALDRARLAKASKAGKKFALLVTNALTGGTARAIDDIDAAAGAGNAATRLTLRCRDDGFIALTAEDPALHATFAPHEITALFDVIGGAAPGHVVIHQLLGFSAAFIERLTEWVAGLHSVLFVHDYYPLCPRVTMIDAVGRFCDVADSDTCGRCVAMAGAHEASRLTALTPAVHRAMFGDLLRAIRHVIAPSASAATYFSRAFPGLPIETIPHPEPNSGIAAAARAADHDGEIILLGAIGPHKGSARLLEIAQRARLTHPDISFRVIGFTDLDRQLTAIGNVTITGRYQPEDLPRLVAQARGRLALFLHAWPETYSYTLSEAAKYGFIPLVPDIGAPAARIRAASYGAVFPFPFNAEQILGLIDEIRANRTQPVGPDGSPARLFPTVADTTRLRHLLGTPAAPEPQKRPRRRATR